MIYYVNHSAAPGGDGTEQRPFLSIQQAADAAMPGDQVWVFPGIYREWVRPRRGGTSEARIVYRSVEPGAAVITGAEALTGWERVEGGVWRASISNARFEGRNPYTTRVSGDWFTASHVAHTGEVVVNGRALYEATSKEGVWNPVRSHVSWEPEFSVYTWFAEQDEAENETVFYANFHQMDPNAERVECTARAACFAPEETGLGYITLSGFTVRQAATQWAPPTAYQEGMIAPHWSKGWIIEDCDISLSKCSGISLGKVLQPENDNKWLHKKYKDGTQTQRECVCQAWREGWSKETVGSHIVRRCHIHDCGQTGIVGHLGGVFSIIEDNHIHHINIRQNLAGAEIGGIKMHAAIDVIYRRNHIHHCTRGIWLDWQAQGTRVTANLFHDNTLPYAHLMNEDALEGYGEDLFLEVSHGPTLIDNNVFLSTRAMKLPTQGAAVVHNLIGGALTAVGTGTDNGAPNVPSPRYTPYHVPHSTDIAGFMTFLHGDMRFYNNVFVQGAVDPYLTAAHARMAGGPWDDGNVNVGLSPYEAYPDEATWKAMFDGYCGMGSAPSDRYYLPLPVWAGGNAYLGGATPLSREDDAFVRGADGPVGLSCGEDGAKLNRNLFELIADARCGRIDTGVLGEAFEPEQKFENPDGTPISLGRDYFGNERPERSIPGPFADGAAWRRAAESLRWN